jgi:hypothetical protein
MAMVGVIWFVQIVHYPLFARVGKDEFPRYEREHCRVTSYVVIPFMLIELATAVGLLWQRPPAVGPGGVWLGLGLLAAIWIVTFTVQVPQHNALINSYDGLVQQRLVWGNWLRTVAWSGRGILVLWMVWRVLGAANLTPRSSG